MKTPFAALASTFAFAAAASLVTAAAPAPCCPPEPATPPCCTEKSPATPPACCTEKATAAKPSCCEEIASAAPLSARSLYQLDAKWTDDAGRTVTLATWRGRPVVLAMFFASCEYACPVLVHDIQRLREKLSPEARERTQVVLVTFDTVRDTPAALQAFRERMKLDSHWSLLTGADDAVRELAMLLGVKFKQDARGQFAHSNLFTVLNPEGEIAHQHAGLMGDISPAAKVLAQAKN
jgi:protein SCO1/2